jgi:hypothetical protein
VTGCDLRPKPAQPNSLLQCRRCYSWTLGWTFLVSQQRQLLLRLLERASRGWVRIKESRGQCACTCM